MSSSLSTSAHVATEENDPIETPTVPINNEQVDTNDETEEPSDVVLITLREFTQQCQALLQQTAANLNLKQSVNNYHNSHDSNSNSKNKEDPFDCHELAVPSMFDKVDELLPAKIQEWRELDRRKITTSHAVANPARASKRQRTNEEDNQEEEEEDPMDASTTTTTARKSNNWFDRHVRLPEQFDYTNQGEPPPKQAAPNEDRVVSLDDPTDQSTSYAHELWHLFDSVPRSLELTPTKEGLVRTRAVVELASRLEKKKFGRETEVVAAERGLLSLRMSERHDFPRPAPTSSSSALLKKGTLVLEIFQPPHGWAAWGSPDPCRMVLEFASWQTLQHVHEAIVELSEDRFWKQVQQWKKQQQQQLQQEPNTGGEGSQTQQQSKYDHSGFLFSEGTFYTTGSVDYVQPIQEWLVSGNSKQQASRWSHLGLSPSLLLEQKPLPVQPMSSMSLQDWPIRLGRRYTHVHHGNVECSVFVADLTWRDLPSQVPSFPILHDIWSFPLPMDCAACQFRSSTIVTSTSCDLTDGHRPMCQECVQEFFPRGMGTTIQDIQFHDVWSRHSSDK